MKRQWNPGASRSLAGATFAVLIGILLLAPAAQAAPSRAYQSSFGSFTGASPQALAVDQSTGDVYAVDVTGGKVHRFASAGAPSNFTAGPNSGTNALSGFSFSGIGLAQVAVDRSGGPAAGTVYVTDTGNDVVKAFASSGALLATLSGSGTPAGSFFQPCGVAVDNSNGAVFVADSSANRVWRYTPAASPVAEAHYSGGIATEISPCGLAAHAGKVYVGETSAGGPLLEFAASDFALGVPPEPSGDEIAGAATAVAVDPSNGDVYIDEGSKVSVLDTNGTSVYSFGSAAEFGANSAGVAVRGSAGSAYVADRHAGGSQVDVFVRPPVMDPVTVHTGTTATFSGEVVSGGAAVSYHFEYSPNGVTWTSVPAIDVNAGTAPDTIAVSQNANGLTGSQLYRVRLVQNRSSDDGIATSAQVTFITDPAEPAITESAASGPSTNGTILSAKVNPQNQPTTYHFEYGSQGPCSSNPCASVPIPDASAGAGGAPVLMSRGISGLTPRTTYHFRLVATNASSPPGGTAGPDRTFATYSVPPSFRPCSNDALRTGLGARLPDCRAYEQASPVDKTGNDVTGKPDYVQASGSGDAISFIVMGGVPGGTGSQDFPTYVARRGTSDWTIGGMLPPASMGEKSKVRGWTPDLSLTFADLEGTDGFKRLLARSADGSIATVATAQSGTTYFPAGASSDGSKVFFEVSGPTLAPGAAPGKANLYVWDRDTGVTTLVGRLPDSACGSPPCTPVGGSFAGPYSWYFGDNLSQGGLVLKHYVQTQHAISEAGDKAYFTAGETGQIYLRRNPVGPGASTSHVNASQRAVPDPTGPQPAIFVGATPDGEHAFFTSSVALTDDANTGPDPVVPPQPPAIVRANLNGTGAETSFIPTNASSIAVDDTHVYWADSNAGTIGRANIDGTAPDPGFIAGLTDPRGIAVDDTHVYWASADGIGRAETDGPTEDRAFITGINAPAGIAVDDTHVYWSNPRGANSGIGRANLSDGSGVNEFFVNLAFGDVPRGVAVNDTHIFAIVTSSGGIGTDFAIRLDNDGSDEIFIPLGATCSPIRQLAIDASHVYWMAQGHRDSQCNPPSSIGRANLDLTGVDYNFITDPSVDFGRGIAADGSHLYWSVNPPRERKPGNDLYRYDAATGDLTDIAPDSGSANGAEVRGVLGYSDDGSHVYFVANGDLDGPGPAEPGDCILGGEDFDQFGACSLYHAHGGGVDFIARLDAEGTTGVTDANNWKASPIVQPDFFQKTSRVSSDGETLLFRSQVQLTSYENEGVPQIYLYHASEEEITCMSCNPTGAPPSGGADLQAIRPPSPAAPSNTGTVLTRNLSADGERAFFDSPDKLVGTDVNGVNDVYEWEAEGKGSCEEPGGCLYLLSPGTGATPSYFGDASVSGDAAFIYTRHQLVPQDQDGLQDVYVAAVGGGLAAQHAVVPPPCVGEACRGPFSQAPAQQGPASSSFSGPGDPPVKRQPPKCTKPRAKQGKKCSKKGKGKSRGKQAGRNRGGKK
jgi:Low-density lipoprotein receptor repeat class B